MVRDFDLFRLLGALVFVDALLLVIWMTLHPPSRNVIIQTEGTHSVRLVDLIFGSYELRLARSGLHLKC